MIYQLGATSFGVWGIKYLVSPLQRWIYQISRGKSLSKIGSDRHVLLLTTKGRRTGKDRTIPVFYLRDGKKIVICNVRPKTERTNPWVINLKNHPTAKIQIGERILLYQARQATEKKINRFWPTLHRVPQNGG